MWPAVRIKHKAAINSSKHWLHTMIAALCFILYGGHVKEYGPDSLSEVKMKGFRNSIPIRPEFQPCKNNF